jgi:hypothetical protein
MARTVWTVGLAAAAIGMAAPQSAFAQADHQHAPGTPAHDHAGPVVSCTDLATPPWTGLSVADRERIASLQVQLASLATTEAARAAGFVPLAGDVPGMGVHYVSNERTANGVRVDEPDHLLFSKVGGEERLVGAAYAFIDVPEAETEVLFESDLAHWHDHPEIAPEGQTPHMLHVWFVPSSNGPFAGLNFWLPFEGRGITPPSACWMADAEIAELIRNVSFGLIPPGIALDRMISRGQPAVADLPTEPSPERLAIWADMDAAAQASNLNDWIDAAERFLDDLSPAEEARSQMLLGVLTRAQMSSTDRGEETHAH